MAFIPKQNRILACLGKGGVPLGMQVSIPHPSIIEILAYTGFDFAMLCMEHARVGVEQMEHCIRAGDAAGITTIVRVAENNAALIRQAIEAGAQGIVIPDVGSPEEARKAIEAVRYPPDGKLGMCPSIRAAHYSKADWDQYLEDARKQVMVILQIEGRQGVENADRILAEMKPGVDAVGVGYGDLAQEITEPDGRVDFHAAYLAEADKNVKALAKKRGIHFIAMPWPTYDIEGAKAQIKSGTDIMLYYVDQFLFYELCQGIVHQLKSPE